MNQRLCVISIAALTLCGSLACVPAATAADEVLLQIPDNALGFLVIRDLAKASEAIDRVAKQMELPAPELLELAKQRFPVGKGVDESGGVTIAALAGAQRPYTLALLKTTNFNQLVQQLDGDDGADGVFKVKVMNQEMLLANKGPYAAFMPMGHEAQLKEFLSSKSVTTNPKNAAYTSRAQAYLVVTESGVSTLAQFAVMGLQMVKQQLEQAGPDVQRAAAGIGMYEELFKWAGQEVGEVAVGLQVEESGSVYVKKRVALKTSAAIPEDPQRESAVVKLSSLPDWPYAIAMAGEMSDGAAMEQLFEMSFRMMQTMGDGQELSAEDMKKMVEGSKKLMATMKGMSFIFGVPKKDESIYSRMGMVVQTSDAKEYLGDYIKYTAKVSELFNKTGFYKIGEAKEQQVAGLPGAKLVMELSLDQLAQGPQAEEIKKMLGRIYGNGGKITFYLAHMDANRVAIGYDSEENVKAVIAAARTGRGLGASPSHMVTAKLLSGKPHWAGYISPQGIVQYAEWMVNLTATLAPGGVAPQVPAFPGNTPPFGFGATFTGDGIEAEMVAPAETLTGMGRYAKAVQQAAGR